MILSVLGRYVEVCKYVNEVRKAGLIQQIGLCNFDTYHMQKVVEAGVPICSNQVALFFLIYPSLRTSV